MPTIHDALAAWQAKDFATARAVCTELGPDDRHARFLLGLMESFGDGGVENPAAAAEHYRAAAEAGHAGAQYNLAALYALGRGVPREPAEALKWYRRSAEGGDADAMFQLGMMYASGEGCDREPGEAAFWFFKAWQGERNDAEREIVRIRADLEAAAVAGSAMAQTALGLILCFGQDDPTAAAEWFEKAAAQGQPESLRTLGYLVEGGKGVPQDDVRAAELYRRAAELGDKFAQFNLAVMIDQARGGLTRDVSQVIRWLRRAVKQGLGDGNHRLAELLAERNRDRRDANEAVQRLVEAARAGEPSDAYRIAAGDASWVATVTKQGTVVALTGLNLDELKGLPEE
jgi:TPR repeat protein